MKIDHLPDNWRYEKRGQSYAVFDENGKQVCGAKLRKTRAGLACRKDPEKGRLRCNLHQGEKRVGPDNPSWKGKGTTSRYYRHIPPRLQSRYTEMLESGELANLAENIALLDLLLAEQLNRLDIGQFGASYNNLRSLHLRANRAWDTALHSTEADARRSALQDFTALFNEMGDLISTGQRDYVTLQQILSLNSERRQTVKTMSDIEMKGENAIPVAQFMVIIARLEDDWRDVNRIPDEDERQRQMALRLQKIINFPA